MNTNRRRTRNQKKSQNELRIFLGCVFVKYICEISRAEIYFYKLKVLNFLPRIYLCERSREIKDDFGYYLKCSLALMYHHGEEDDDLLLLSLFNAQFPALPRVCHIPTAKRENEKKNYGRE